MATFPIYQIYVQLEDYSPKMWRRFQVMSDITIAKLGYIIMGLFEVRNFYSYEFRIDELENYKKKHPEYETHPELLEGLNRSFKKLRYGITYKKNMYSYRQIDGYGELLDATAEKLLNVIKTPNEELIFRYDPEINWKFKITVEKVFIDKTLYAKDLPRVLEGSGFGIIEQLSGAKGLKEAREKLKKRNWINYLNYTNYKTYDNRIHQPKRLGKSNDRLYLDDFDVEDMNYRIRKLPKIFKERYEQELRPTIKQIKLMKRKYIVFRKNQTKANKNN